MSPWGRHAREPAALPVSWEAATPLERARQERNRLWQPRLQRATDEAARAARQARWVAPAPRLVARPLAHDWEETLTAQRPLQEAYDRFGQAHPPRRSGAACEASRQRAQTSPARWQAPTTTRADRQALVRQVVHRMLVAGEGTSERLQLPLDGVGGVTTAGRTTRPLRPIEPLR